MKKNYLFTILACLFLACLNAVATSSAGNSHHIEGVTEVKTALGFLISDYEHPVGFYSFSVDNATEMNIIRETNKVSAGAMTKYGYYAATYDENGPTDWCKVNPETGEMTRLASLNGKMYTDMSYDYSSGKMYAISHPTTETTELLTINLSDGTKSKVMDIQLQLMTLACSYSGDLYSIDTQGILYSIDKNTKKLTPLTHMNFQPEYMQSMEFDHETGFLYWAACSNSYSMFYKINVGTLENVSVSNLGNGGEMTGLYIPFKLAETNAPDAITELSTEILPTENMVRFSWKFPSTTVAGDVLTSMTSLSVECDGTLLKRYVNGTDYSWTTGERTSIDLEVIPGIHVFKIYVTNESGDGLPIFKKIFIGEDIPAAPTNLQVVADGDHATLTWGAVTTGSNGGDIDLATLRYTIIRWPGKVVVADHIEETTYIDQPEATDVYAYEVVASTRKGAGDRVRSEWMPVGVACDLPFSYKFDDEIRFKLWTVVDQNADDVTWKLSYTNEGTPAMEYRYSSDNDADDWLFTPALKLTAGKAYKLKFDCGVQNPKYPERLKITMGTNKTIEDQTIVLETYDLTEYGLNSKIIYLPKSIETGNWYFAFQACSDKDMSKLYLSDVEVLENISATFKGTVLYRDTPMPEVKVTLSNSDKEYLTDNEGNFYIQEIKPGSYTLTASLFGFTIFTEELTFSTLENKVKNIHLTALPKVNIYGYVKTQQGENMPNAAVYLHGYDNYSTQTDKDGKYKLEDVFCKGDYTLEAYATNYEKSSLSIPAFTEDVTVEDFLLKEKLLSPAPISANASRSEVHLTWNKPEDKLIQFRYDDGQAPLYVLNMEFDANDNTVSGCIYDTPTMFTGISWQVADNSSPKTTVDVIILDLDENGNPTRKVLFEQKGIPSTDSYWSSFQLPYPITAPRGALIALKGDAHLCMDYGESTEWPFVEKRSCLNFDYKVEDFIYLEERNLPYNLLVRAEGVALGAPYSKIRSIPTPQPEYRVWRLAEEDEANIDKWTELTAQPIKATEFTDATWQNAAKGVYKYAVRAVYTGTEYSHPAFTEIIPRLMTSEISVSLTTNAVGESVQDASMTLVNQDEIHSYKAAADENGKMIFPTVWEGTYIVVIERKGFQSVTDKITVEGGKNISLNYSLAESTQKPANLKIDVNGVPGSRLFRWNVIEKWEDGFEGHDNFTINSPGELGWSYIDGDGAPTYASSSYEFPHQNEPMAFIVFNPSATSPDMLDETMPHSGDKMLCCFACTGGVANNDYLISPELEMSNDFVIRFWACSYDNRFLEEIRVGYSTTGKEEDDFIWLGENQTIPAKWTEYIVSIPKDAKYVTINCISNDRYMLMLDDIYIGTPQQPQALNKFSRIAGQPVSYEVYLDGKHVITTTETSYTFTNLPKGEHVAGVKSVYASGATEMTTITFDVEETGSGILKESADNGFVLYPLPAHETLYINGQYDKAQLINPTGQVVLQTDYTSKLSIGDYPAGLYYLILEKEGKSTVLKVPVK